MIHKKLGFTLIELLTVVLILAVLTSVALPQYRRSIYRAEAANALVNLKSLYDSAKRAYAMNSEFPSSFASLDVKLLADENTGATLISGGYKFEFVTSPSNGVKGCRYPDSQTDSLCLQVSYVRNGKRDVYTCSATGKYVSVCEAMGPCTDGTCVIE